MRHSTTKIIHQLRATDLLLSPRNSFSSKIQHWGLPRDRAASMVRHNDTLYLSGQVPDVTKLDERCVCNYPQNSLLCTL